MFGKNRSRGKEARGQAPEPPSAGQRTSSPAGGSLQERPTAPVIRAGSSSEKGEHDRNEDSCSVGWDIGCYAVSDGIGGAPDGDIMSRVACGAVMENYAETKDVVAAFKAGNAATIQVSKWIANADCGATLLVAAQEGDELRFAWAGDSALFRMRDGALLRLTTEERKEDTNILLSAVGYDPALEPMTARSSIKPGDAFLMCTDGVWTVYKEQDRMGELLASLWKAGNGTMPVVAAAREIVFSARIRGYDDATAVVLVAEEPGSNGQGTLPGKNLMETPPPPGTDSPLMKTAEMAPPAPRWKIVPKGGELR